MSEVAVSRRVVRGLSELVYQVRRKTPSFRAGI